MSQFVSALDVFRLDIRGPHPIRESEGHNRSPEIDRMNLEVGNPLGAPYCAAGMSHGFRVFSLDQPQAPGMVFPYSGGSQAILAWCRGHDLVFTDPDHLMNVKGALAGWTNKDGGHGHIYAVEKRFTDGGGHVVSIGTLEYNTSPQTKDRDGEGAYALVRTIDELREQHPRFWFIDTTKFRGGVWWP